MMHCDIVSAMLSYLEHMITKVCRFSHQVKRPTHFQLRTVATTKLSCHGRDFSGYYFTM
jgi:hypothetical protein